MAKEKDVFCEEPWTGLFSVNTNGDVIFCPCYAKLKIGNIREGDAKTIWNGPAILGIRESFVAGEIPPACKGQLCPVVVNQSKRPDRESA